MPITTLDILEVESRIVDQNDHQEAVILARNYFIGKQDVYLTDRAREYLGVHGERNPFRFNICKSIVRAVSDELNLLGFSTDEDEPEEGEETIRPAAEWVAELFELNRLDSVQKEVHKSALSDSESFVIVEWDPEQERATLTHNPYYVGTDAGGDGMGAYMIYENDDPNQEPIAAVKRWIEVIRSGPLASPRSRLRMTIYYPDHFERWVYQDAGVWEHFTETIGFNEDGEEIIRDWYIPNIDPDGEPLGIPVFHFKNEDLTPEHWDAIPMQDSINKTLVDVLAAGDLTAFQSFFGFGFYPTTDGKAPNAEGTNLMKMGPAQFNGTTKAPDQASLQVISGQDTSFLMEQFKDLVLSTAQLTDTPASRFIVTAAIASDKTIKEQEKGLRKKGKTRRALWGDPWVGAVNMARALSNIYGRAAIPEDVTFAPIWEHTDSLEELAEKKTTLEIPIEQIWREAGYTEAEIEVMRKDPSFRVEFERKLWEGYNAASISGIPLRLYLERIGIPEGEIKKIESAIVNQSGVPTETL